MTERENGWYLRSEGYMTSEYSYQRIGAMKGNRALDNHQKLVFVKFTGGEEKDSRVYVPHPGTCELEKLEAIYVTLNMLGSIEWGACSECGCAVPMDAKFCNECGKAVKR